MTALRGMDVVAAPLDEAVKELRTVPRSYYALVRVNADWESKIRRQISADLMP